MPTCYCIGKNYAAHVREMGDVVAQGREPVVFLKPWNALLPAPGPIRLPADAGEVHHEAEIVVRVGEGADVEAVGLGLDLTDRTRQARAKEAGLPWATAKGFAGAAPLGPLRPAGEVGALDALRFTLTVNGALRQSGDTSRLLTPIPDLLAWIDRWFGLEPGDLVFTGTPEGVAAIHPGDRLDLTLEGVPAASATFDVA